MLRNASELTRLAIHATDGDIGSVKTLLFDDEHWTVRYLVVDTGTWLPGRKVLISPIAIQRSNWNAWTIDVSLTREQVKSSPDVDTAKPVSRQRELDYYRYYGYPYYWGGAGIWGAGAYPGVLALTDEALAMAEIRADQETGRDVERDTHLRDVTVVTGYHLRATDGDIGHVEDFLVDDRTWTIRYLVVDTSNWLGGRRVLIAPSWVTAMSWDEAIVHLAITREAVTNSPAYERAVEVGRDYEERLYSHYGRPGYWVDEPGRRDHHGTIVDARFARLEDLDDVEVADGEPDIRGWHVVAADGPVIGSVEHLIVDRSAMKVRYLEVGLEDSAVGADRTHDVLVPLETVDLEGAREQVRLRTLPSTRVAALPPFGGFPIDTEYEQRVRAQFGAGDR